MVPGRVVVLGLEADDSCEEKCKSGDERAVKLRLEWNDNFGMSWNFRVFGRFRTGRNLDLWNSVCVVFCQLSRALHEFSFLLHDMSMGFIRVETTVICFAVLWRVVHALAVGSGLSLRFATSLHYFCFCLRHWSLVDHILPVKMCGTHLGVVVSDLCRKCESSVKVCGTHLRMNKREFVLGMAWNGWVVICMVIRGIVELNCRLCPSCIWAPAYPSECIRPCLGDSSNSWQRTRQLQQPRQFQRQRESFLCLRIQRCRHRQELLKRIPRKRKNRILLMCMEMTRKTKRKEMLEEMTIDRDLRGWECMNHLIMVMPQTCWVLPRAWPWESLRWLLRWKGRRTNLRPSSRVHILFSRTFAEAWRPWERQSITWHVHQNHWLLVWTTTPAEWVQSWVNLTNWKSTWSGRWTSLWKTCSRITRKAAWNEINPCRMWWPSSTNRWTNYKKIWSWLLRGLKRGHRRQRQLQHMILRNHPWDILACHRAVHHWHRHLARVSRLHRQCHQDLWSRHHRRCRRWSSQGIARQGWVKYQWAIPWLWRWKTLNHHLLRWSRRSRGVSDLFHPHHVTILWRGRQRSPL